MEDLEALLSALVQRHARALGRDEAAELAAEALARALERPPPDGRLEPWVERILRNLAMDHWRRRSIERRNPPPCPEAAPGPEELLLAGERRRLLRRALSRLPRPLRRAVLLRYREEGAGRQEVAVRVRVHRGLTRLRRLLEGMRVLVPAGGRFLSAALVPASVAALLVAPAPPAPSPTPAPVHLAQARSPRAAPPAHPATAAAPVAIQPRPAPVRRLEFEDDVVSGELERPSGVVVQSTTPTKHASLIEIPSSMVPAIAQSLEDL